MESSPGVLSGIPYASRFGRLVAFLIDAGLGFGLLAPIYLPQLQALSGQMSLESGLIQVQASATNMPYFLGAILVLLLVQIVLLTVRGQTVGKLICMVKIVRKDTMLNGGFVTNVLMRGLLNGAAAMIPFYFFVDSLFILRSDRRCLHDFIAGTIVVRA